MAILPSNLLPEARYSWDVNRELWRSEQEVFVHKLSISNNGFYICLVNNPTTGCDYFKIKEVTIVGKWLLVTSGSISGVQSSFL